jgi:cyclopropane-fatty-acyl-phospholipid synthase
MPLGKTRMGIPNPGSPLGVVLSAEARRSRHRLYPVTAIYTSLAVVVLLLGVRSNPWAAAVLAVAGLAFWTLVEYLVHRYVLHGVFPARRSLWSRFLNKAFDHLHWQHHLRPWDGNHINGTLFDTLWVVAPAFALSLLAPLHTVPSFLAGFILGYVIEEWCHHSVHFYVLDWRWFRDLKARHFYHHSRLGSHILFGLSNGFWDDVVGTGMPAPAGSGVAPSFRPAPVRLPFLRGPAPVVPSLGALRRSLRMRLGSPLGARRWRSRFRRPPEGGACSSDPRA